MWRYHLAMAYAKAGQSAQARATLKAALKPTRMFQRRKKLWRWLDRLRPEITRDRFSDSVAGPTIVAFCHLFIHHLSHSINSSLQHLKMGIITV